MEAILPRDIGQAVMGPAIIVNTSSERFLDWSLEYRREEITRATSDVYILLMSDFSFGAADGEVPPAGPLWLRSGARHHFTGQTWKPAGLQTCSTTKRYFEETWISSDVPLSDIATPEGYREVNAAWQLALLGVDLLAELAGPEAVVAYLAALKSGTTWEQEFSNAFGMTVDEFYELFEERRAAGFPRPRCSLADFPSLSATIQHRPWFEDDLSEAEDSAVEWLLKLAIYGEEETAAALTSMPFLESVESDDILVLRGITYLEPVDKLSMDPGNHVPDLF